MIQILIKQAAGKQSRGTAKASDPQLCIPPRKKRPLLDNGVSPEAPSDNSAPRQLVSRSMGSKAAAAPKAPPANIANKSKKAKMTKDGKPQMSKISQKLLCQKGSIIAEQYGVDYRRFQKDHYAESVPPPAGHWQSFLLSIVAKDAPALSCSVCKRLRHEVDHPHEEDGADLEARQCAEDVVPMAPIADARGVDVAAREV